MNYMEDLRLGKTPKQKYEKKFLRNIKITPSKMIYFGCFVVVIILLLYPAECAKLISDWVNDFIGNIKIHSSNV